MRLSGSEVTTLSLRVVSAALAALAALSCSDQDPPAFLPELPPGCSRAQRMQRLAELGSLEERFDLLARQPRSPATSDELLTSLRDVLARPCLDHAAALLPLPEYASWESIAFAADHGLFPALRDLTAIHRIGGRRALALPPELLPELDPAARLELRALACPDDGVTPCVDSAAALAPLTAELVRQALAAADDAGDKDDVPLLEPEGAAHRRGAFDERRGELLSPCRARWREVWQTGDPTTWFACVRQRAPRQLRYHAPAKIRDLDRGWLSLRRYEGHHADDYQLWTFDLASGAAYVATARGLGVDGEAAIQRRSGRVPVAELRQLALALLARPALVRVRTTPTFVELPSPSPSSFTPSEMAEILDEEGPVDRLAEEAGDGQGQDASYQGPGQTRFVLADGASLYFEGYFRSPSAYGTSRFAAEQLTALIKALDETCTPSAYPALPELALAPRPARTDDCFACLVDDNFRHLGRALAELPPRRCGELTAAGSDRSTPSPGSPSSPDRSPSPPASR